MEGPAFLRTKERKTSAVGLLRVRDRFLLISYSSVRVLPGDMATRRLRPEDWAPVPQTRIQIRATTTQSREPREERARFPKCAQKTARPAPINYPPGESPPIPKGRESLETDSPRAPEVVDFATPGTWPRRALPPHIAYQQQQWGPKRVATPGSVSQYSSRQSEMSFGILDYYTRDPSPTRSPTLPPPTPRLLQRSQGPPKIGTPVIDPAMEKFDFGLPLKPQRPRSQVVEKKDPFEPTALASDAAPGAQQQRQEADLISTPSPAPPSKHSKLDQPPSKPLYSLFPKDTTPPSRPSITLANRADSSPPTLQDSNSPTPLFSHAPPDPSYRPRKESLTSSLRSRKDSFTSYRVNSSQQQQQQQQRIPLRVFSAAAASYSSHRTTSSIYTTPRPSHPVDTTSSSSSPPSAATTTAGTHTHHSRWSDESIASPTLAAFSPHSARRTSFGSLLQNIGSIDESRVGSGSGQHYPACFFEDDDDEAVPLRRKLGWSGGSGGRVGEGRGRGGGGGGWKRWVFCGCVGR